jgi:hypothetical protein
MRSRLTLTAGLCVTVLAFCVVLGGFTSVGTAEAAPISMLFGPAMRIVQSLQQDISTLSSTVAGFAESFTTNNLSFTSGEGTQMTVQTLCIGQTCIDEAQLQALLAGGTPTLQTNEAASDATTDASTTIIESPIIQVNGDNPAIVQIGDSYNDPGATITGPQQDLNLGIQTFVNGVAMSPVQIDTSQAATDTIDYVATDEHGLTSTTTRTVIIEAPSIVPTETASSTPILSDDVGTTTIATSTFE